jgi:hypothetical protein
LPRFLTQALNSFVGHELRPQQTAAGGNNR